MQTMIARWEEPEQGIWTLNVPPREFTICLIDGTFALMQFTYDQAGVMVRASFLHESPHLPTAMRYAMSMI